MRSSISAPRVPRRRITVTPVGYYWLFTALAWSVIYGLWRLACWAMGAG